MNNRIDILNELQTLSPVLATMEKVNPYKVPEGYFTTLNDDILDKTIFQPSFKNTSIPMHQQVPVGYFDSLASNILGKIKEQETNNAAEELRKLSPMLYALQSEQVFEVPKGYFDTLPAVLMAEIAPREKAKVVSIGKRSIWQYAAAAVVTGIIAASSLWMLNKKETGQTGNDLALLKPAVSKEISEAGKFKSESDINKEIASLPAEEIISYLEKTGTDEDLELLATTINGEELPEQQEYLLDENALNKYLEKLNTELSNN